MSAIQGQAEDLDALLSDISSGRNLPVPEGTDSVSAVTMQAATTAESPSAGATAPQPMRHSIQEAFENPAAAAAAVTTDSINATQACISSAGPTQDHTNHTSSAAQALFQHHNPGVRLHPAVAAAAAAAVAAAKQQHSSVSLATDQHTAMQEHPSPVSYSSRESTFTWGEQPGSARTVDTSSSQQDSSRWQNTTVSRLSAAAGAAGSGELSVGHSPHMSPGHSPWHQHQHQQMPDPAPGNAPCERPSGKSCLAAAEVGSVAQSLQAPTAVESGAIYDPAGAAADALEHAAQSLKPLPAAALAVPSTLQGVSVPGTHQGQTQCQLQSIRLQQLYRIQQLQQLQKLEQSQDLQQLQLTAQQGTALASMAVQQQGGPRRGSLSLNNAVAGAALLGKLWRLDLQQEQQLLTGLLSTGLFMPVRLPAVLPVTEPPACSTGVAPCRTGAHQQTQEQGPSTELPAGLPVDHGRAAAVSSRSVTTGTAAPTTGVAVKPLPAVQHTSGHAIDMRAALTAALKRVAASGQKQQGAAAGAESYQPQTATVSAGLTNPAAIQLALQVLGRIKGLQKAQQPGCMTAGPGQLDAGRNVEPVTTAEAGASAAAAVDRQQNMGLELTKHELVPHNLLSQPLPAALKRPAAASELPQIRPSQDGPNWTNLKRQKLSSSAQHGTVEGSMSHSGHNDVSAGPVFQATPSGYVGAVGGFHNVAQPLDALAALAGMLSSDK